VRTRDRAAATTAAIIQIIIDAQRKWLDGEAVSFSDVRAEVCAYLRDDYADIQQQTLSEIRPLDD
jgi:hypothetical protein